MTRQKPPQEKDLEVEKTYILERRLANTKSVRFGNTQLTVRYKRIRTKSLRNR